VLKITVIFDLILALSSQFPRFFEQLAKNE